MKNSIIALLLILVSVPGFSQKSKYVYTGRLSPSVKKEKLNAARSVRDITPELWHKLVLPYKERVELDNRRRMDYSLGNYLDPQGSYSAIIEYVTVEIFAISNGKDVRSQSLSEELTAEQKSILNAADLGTDIRIKIRFKYRNQVSVDLGVGTRIIEGGLAVTVVPETEAEFPGGFKQITAYLMENIINKISEAGSFEKIRQVIVKFTVTEEGQLVDVKLFRTSTDLQTDKLVLDAINKMPRWRPAKNSKGINVKQEFSIPFGKGGEGC